MTLLSDPVSSFRRRRASLAPPNALPPCVRRTLTSHRHNGASRSTSIRSGAFAIEADRPAPSFNPAYARSRSRSSRTHAPATSHNPPDSRRGLFVIQTLDGAIRTERRPMGDDGAALPGKTDRPRTKQDRQSALCRSGGTDRAHWPPWRDLLAFFGSRRFRACLQLREERKGIGGGTFGVLARRGIPKSANV